MKIANIDFNVDSLKQITKEEFIEKYRGKLRADINETAKTLETYFKDVQEPKKVSRKRKKSKSEDTV